MPFDENGAFYNPTTAGGRNYILPYGTDKSDAVTYRISKVSRETIIEDETFEALLNNVYAEGKRILDKTFSVKSINLPAAGQGAGSVQKVATKTYAGTFPENYPRTAYPSSQRYGYPSSATFTWDYIKNDFPERIRGDGDIENIDDDTGILRNNYNLITKLADEVGIDNPGPKTALRTIVRATHINDFIDEIVAAGKKCICNTNYCACNCNYCTCNCNYACTCDCDYSDVRLKENIEFLYEKNNLKFYSYNYIWDKKIKKVGVLAQELLNTKYSNALCRDADGFYMVDYNKLPI